MNEIIELEDFKNLKVNDFILVEWSDFFIKHHFDCEKKMFYRIEKINPQSNEIVCQIKDNHFFNYMMYLGLDIIGVNTSQALKVYKICLEL